MDDGTLSQPPRRLSLMLLAVAAIIGGFGLATVGAVQHAQAAVINGAVRNITVSPTNPRPATPIRTQIAWCVPDGTKAGDTFSITMPEQLGGFPPGFPLRDPDGELVATATISGNPVVATFTMTEYAETRRGVCGDAFFESRLKAGEIAGTTQTLIYTVNGGVTFERVIEVREPFGPVETKSGKRGVFTNSGDQCRTSVTDCIEWVITSRAGPYKQVEFADVAADGMTFNCDSVSIRYRLIKPDGSRGGARDPGAVGGSSSVDCGADSLSATTGPVPANTIVEMRVKATPELPAEQGGVVYSNVASISHNTNEREVVDTVRARTRSAVAGGSGNGILIDIEKLDTDGNDADTAAESVSLPDGTADLVFTITNNGGAELIDVVVSDVVIAGDANVSGLTCDFSTAAAGAPTSGTTWAGPFPPGASFDCTASLTGVEVGVPHANRATVTGVGEASGETVVDDDDYHANREPESTTTTAPPTTTPPTTTTTPPTTTPGDTTTTVAATTTSVAQQAVTTTPSPVSPTTVPSGPTTSLSPADVPLPATGSSLNMAGIGLALIVGGALLAGFAARRRPAGTT